MPERKLRQTKKQKPKVAFNHAMIYVRDVARAQHFYQDLLGLKTIDVFQFGSQAVYARLQSAIGTTTIALHQVERGHDLPPFDSIRLYFEVKELGALCKSLQAEGVEITQLPKPMPWGWTHAYLNDPDGHEVSLYWAGVKRLRRSGTVKKKAAAK
ncbi:MAG: VOC family protein [Bryobacteraceae bacterium]|jgi:catechol 2,3-dioxygenase-like lactoylglutathione lyase family enzyme